MNRGLAAALRHVPDSILVRPCGSGCAGEVIFEARFWTITAYRLALCAAGAGVLIALWPHFAGPACEWIALAAGIDAPAAKAVLVPAATAAILAWPFVLAALEKPAMAGEVLRILDAASAGADCGAPEEKPQVPESAR